LTQKNKNERNELQRNVMMVELWKPNDTRSFENYLFKPRDTEIGIKRKKKHYGQVETTALVYVHDKTGNHV